MTTEWVSTTRAPSFSFGPGASKSGFASTR